MALYQEKGTTTTFACDRPSCGGRFMLPRIGTTFFPKFCPWCANGPSTKEAEPNRGYVMQGKAPDNPKPPSAPATTPARPTLACGHKDGSCCCENINIDFGGRR